ncbi:hypothetical protein [Ralstonia solanacearum]|uniref:DUF7255 family protein n=1 Tax=Ralstonia solanacearum TaxID=305 RepID=UPI00236545D7|nr:hypothetical protein [Ralstonia solanacearum]MDD7803740.1 hypothetical protein [Ralstonia solanacearum]
MGAMQRTFEELLASVGTVAHKTVPFPRLQDIAQAGFEAVNAAYKSLGGVLMSAELNLRSWDLEFDGVAVELDEYLHFNRYRAITLQAPEYALLPRFPKVTYQDFCNRFETECLDAGGYGGKWSNRSCEHQFGMGSAHKVLEGGGAPRWKQRAFYDFVKDLAPLTVGVKVARVAIWDVVMDSGVNRLVKDILFQPTTGSAEALAALVRARTG